MKFIAVELANAIMNPEQFERYTQGLALLSNESRQASQAAAMRSEQNKLTNKLIRQTVMGRQLLLQEHGWMTFR